MGKYFTTHKTEGVTVIVLDAEGDKVNKLSTGLGQDLEPLLQQLNDDTSCAGVVIISSKPDNFIVGADIDQLARLKTAEEATTLSREGHRMMDRLASMRVPVVAAIHGSCLGGGLELGLACASRVCADSADTKLGFPEVMLGLIPGAGGTQRAPRLIGVQAALDMILTSKNIRPKKALKMGLVDEVVPGLALETAAVSRVLKLAAQKRRAEKKNVLQAELDELRRWTKDVDVMDLLLGGNPLGRMVVFKKGREAVQSKTRGNYPAPFAALRAVEAGLAKGMEAGLKVEAEEFGKLVVSDVSKRLTEIFYATQAIKKDTGVSDPKVKPIPVERLVVLGGGLMGSGIAYVAADAKIQARIKEMDHDASAKAIGAVAELIGSRVKRRSITSREAEIIAARVTATPDLSGIRRADLVIEAVFEDLALKQKLLKQMEEVTGDRCIFGSNTSSLPITKIAEASRRPERVLGMHFFSPVHKMPLLEVITTAKTGDEATATAVEFGKRVGKQVIVVRDGVGFYTSRILAPYMNEAAHVLAEGAAMDAIDAAMMDFGFPVGPITLMDEIGIDVGAKVAMILFEAFGERMHPVEALKAVIDDKRCGRKNKRGFYTYDEKKKRPDESAYDLLGGRKRKPINVEEAQRRIALPMVNEAMHCFGEKILRSARDGNIGAIFGLGFPPFLGGPFRYVDVHGADKVVDELKRLQDRFGARFTPAPALVDAARDHRKFCD